MNKTVLVSVSGGKDSTATLLLALEKENNVRGIFADTGNEHPLTYEYLEYLEKTLGITFHRVKADFSRQIEMQRKFILEKWPLQGVPDEKVQRAASVMVPTGIPFLDLCLWKSRFPSSRSQFCTSELKTLPLTAFSLSLVEEGYFVESWQGIRREESRKRATYSERELLHESIEVYRPILDWKLDDVISFVKSKGVELNPLYKHGQTRVGCVPCINIKKKDLRHIALRFPEVIDRIEAWEKIVGDASKRDSSTFFSSGTDNEVAYQEGNIRKIVEWAVGERPSLFLEAYEEALEEEMGGCSSSFGLCE